LGMAQSSVFGTATSALSAATASSTQIVLPIPAFVPAAAAFVVTLSGLSLGAAQAATAFGFKVSSSADPAFSNGLDAPAIMPSVAPAPIMTMFMIAAADRVAGKSMVEVILEFKPNTALPAAGRITLNYPAGFFASTAAPFFHASSVVALTGAVSVPAATSLVITTAAVSIACCFPVTITLRGLTMGAATAGSATGITIQTDSDPIASAGVYSGEIRPVTSVSFSFSSITMAVNAAGAPVSPVLVFTPAFSVPIGGAITLTMPAGYFLGSVTSIASTLYF